MGKQPKYPCRNCVYFKACGDNTRTMPCEERQTKSKKKFYHMIIQRSVDWTGETRREYISTRQGSAPAGWICVGVCGYHEKAN